MFTIMLSFSRTRGKLSSFLFAILLGHVTSLVNVTWLEVILAVHKRGP